MSKRIYIYDSTLRDGSQARGIDFTVSDKRAIAKLLDEFGIDYIEGGFSGANPIDSEFFRSPPKLRNIKLTAFGMTKKSGVSASNDKSLNSLLQSGVKNFCLVGKSSSDQVTDILEIDLESNLKMIGDSVSHLKKHATEVLFDAEHFFDGYKRDSKYSLECLFTAFEKGADWLILCDTNGGSMPYEIERITAEILDKLNSNKSDSAKNRQIQIGIHCHNDTENAVANSLAAVRAGATQIQGTINGIGERCGNANLIPIIANLELKMGYKTGVGKDNLSRLTYVSKFIDERLNIASNQNAAYVGSSAFVHKGGLHAAAVIKKSSSYEHIKPESIGNKRNILVSDKAGRSGLLAKLKEMGVRIKSDDSRVDLLLEELKNREHQGYAYESAEASFELLVRSKLSRLPDFFRLIRFNVVDERRISATGETITISEATVKIAVDKSEILTAGEGKGPVHALDEALRKALIKYYPLIKNLKLIDYKVRILNPENATEATTRVMIETTNIKTGDSWNSIGVSPNIIDASYQAYRDSITYFLIKQ